MLEVSFFTTYYVLKTRKNVEKSNRPILRHILTALGANWPIYPDFGDFGLNESVTQIYKREKQMEKVKGNVFRQPWSWRYHFQKNAFFGKTGYAPFSFCPDHFTLRKWLPF